MTLTVRQLYYRFVGFDLLPNNMSSYKTLVKVISDARLSGLIDWNAIVDRTRKLEQLSHWDTPEDIVQACAEQYRVDMWEFQPVRVEVWIEKQALVGVIDRICEKWDVPYFACRGYVSQSEQWRAAQRFRRHRRAGQHVVVLHMGDHDPSGIDMTRDNDDRLDLFGSTVELKRIALNMDQIEEHGPPPNPAKLTDTRASDYIARFGRESWELDALEPSVIKDLIESAVTPYIDQDQWTADVARVDEGRARIAAAAENM